MLFDELRKDVGEVLRTLCEMKEVVLIEGATQPDHVHVLVAIPAKLSVSEFMGYQKGKAR